MPELPDVALYVEHLERRVVGQTLERVRLASPFLLRTVDPPLREAEGRRVAGVRRIGKRIALALDGDLFLVVHLMIAGRLHWKARGAQLPRRGGLCAFDFPSGTLLLTEISKKKRASLHVMRGSALGTLHRGGVEPLEADLATFSAALRARRHTLKRALCDPAIVAGLGNAYSDEILHAARLSPMRMTTRLGDAEMARLFEATRTTLGAWITRLREQTGDTFPEKVTAFRPEMAVHGRHRKPCPACRTAVQRIVHAENECNYCPRCQTGGKLLADRALSRLLREDWPRTIEELEERRACHGEAP